MSREGSNLLSTASDHAARYRAIAGEERARWNALHGAQVQTWADAWELSVACHGTRPALQEVGGRPVTYEELDRAADHIAAWVLAHGEERYGVRLRNGVAFLATVLGLAKAGRLAVLL